MHREQLYNINLLKRPDGVEIARWPASLCSAGFARTCALAASIAVLMFMR